MDRGELLYPGFDEAAFVAALSPTARGALQGPVPRAYAGDAAATIALMRRLQADYGHHALVTLASGVSRKAAKGAGLRRRSRA